MLCAFACGLHTYETCFLSGWCTCDPQQLVYGILGRICIGVAVLRQHMVCTPATIHDLCRELAVPPNVCPSLMTAGLLPQLGVHTP